MAAVRRRTARKEDDPSSEKDDKPVVLEVDASDRWTKLWRRVSSSVVMIGGFLLLLWLGHLACVALVLGLVCVSFHEIIMLSQKSAIEKQTPPLNLALNWLYFLTAIFFFYGRVFIKHFENLLLSEPRAAIFVRYHLFISFSLYIFSFLLFVMSLQKGKYKVQIKQLAWTHMTLFVVVVQSSYWVSSIFEGLFWLMLPASLIICNDIWAYIVGFLIGRTPLIKLSPRKTVEGFIGGAVATAIMSVFMCHFLVQFPHFICPRVDLFSAAGSCTPARIFVSQEYLLADYLHLDLLQFLHSIGITAQSFSAYPVQLHIICFSIFASLIAPFGGFFASGFKRAFKLKDFADTIPGHGGITDRMDCQFLMGTFSYVYRITFISDYEDVHMLLSKILLLQITDQKLVYDELRRSLQSGGFV